MSDTPRKPEHRYQNQDPRCRLVATCDLSYCWSYAHHLDGTEGFEDMEAICEGCEYWVPSGMEEGEWEMKA